MSSPLWGVRLGLAAHHRAPVAARVTGATAMSAIQWLYRKHRPAERAVGHRGEGGVPRHHSRDEPDVPAGVDDVLVGAGFADAEHDESHREEEEHEGHR